MNIECGNEVLEELSHNFRFNDAIIRDLVIRRKDAITEESAIKASQSREDRRPPRQEAPRAEEAVNTEDLAAEEDSAEGSED
jgi:small subunit ribosomal protein S6